MLVISRCMSKAYADLVSNFLSSLTNVVLLRLDAYLLHAHPNLDAFRVRNLRAAPVSGGDLFERNLMQEYEQHLIGLGVKPGSKKEQRFHPYKKNKRGGMDVNRLNKGFTTNPCRHPSIWCNCPFFSHHHKVVAEEDVAVAGVVAAEAAQVVPSSSNLLNDIQYQVLPSKNPGLELTMLSGDPLHYVFPVTPLSVLTLLEREKTPCVQSPPEGEKTLCVLSLPEREKTLCVQSPEGEKTLCVQDISNQVQFNSVQEKLQNLPVGGRLRQFLPEWERLGSHGLITGLIRDRYKLPFRERPNLSRVPCIVSSYAGFDKQNALWTSIQDLLQKGAIEVVHTPDSLGFYSRLFLVPKPGNRWRPVIDLSTLKKFLAIPKFKMDTSESIRASLRKGEWVTSIDLTDAYLHVPIHTQSQKYLRFHFQGVTYQFTSLPFGLATAPLIFTSIVKEVKLIALQSGIRLHKYLDDWLIRAPSKQTCTDQTQKLLKLVKDLGFIVDLKKSDLTPSQRFDFLGYHF